MKIIFHKRRTSNISPERNRENLRKLGATEAEILHWEALARRDEPPPGVLADPPQGSRLPCVKVACPCGTYMEHRRSDGEVIYFACDNCDRSCSIYKAEEKI